VDLEGELEPALGTVVEEDRGQLPYALIHGEALVAAAAWALGEAGVTPVDTGTP
jgi:2-C-methyl-D-erythritol 4-phosphate cytidylyltransferase